MKHQEPRGHWILLLLSGFAITVALLVDGFVHGAVGESPHYVPEASESTEPPGSVTSGGPVLNLHDPAAPRSARPKPKTIALTFDDGPDPKWTPQILDILRRHNAHATFFVIGAHVAAEPALTRRIVREGHELGNHTYTHVDLGTAPAWRVRLELDLTQRALAGATGVQTRLLRMPYSATPDGLTGTQWRAARIAGQEGYWVALTDRDTEDWHRPGLPEIVQRAVAVKRHSNEGAIIMLHDSGGDRTETVAAVEAIVSRLSAEGYRFTTLSQAIGLPYATVRVSGTKRLTGQALVWGQQASGWLLGLLQALFAVAGVLTTARLITLPAFAHAHRRRVRRRRPRHSARGGPEWLGLRPVSVIVPAYNEELGIEATVRSLLDTSYQAPVEVIVVDDGSTDRTAGIVAGLDLPGLQLIRKPNGGKPSALNAGIAQARAGIIVLVDGDTVFQRDTIGRLVAPLADPAVGAVSGNTKVANRTGLLGRWQHLEYVIGFNLDRRMFDLLGCMPTIPGAIGAFRREALTEVGGVSTDTLAEDTDLTIAIGRAGWRVVYEETALAWTEAPSSLRQLWRQRYRWCYGTLQAMWKHRGALTESYGRRCLGYLSVFQVLLPLFAPAMDVFALYGVIFLDPVKMLGLWGLFVAAQTVAGGYALWLDGESLKPLWVMPLQQVVYRQLMYLVVIQSMVTAVLGAPLRWHTIRRTGTFAKSQNGTHSLT